MDTITINLQFFLIREGCGKGYLFHTFQKKFVVELQFYVQNHTLNNNACT